MGASGLFWTPNRMELFLKTEPSLAKQHKLQSRFIIVSQETRDQSEGNK